MKTALAVLVCLVAVLATSALKQDNPNFGHKGMRMVPGKFERIFIIQFENQPFALVRNDPNFAKYAQMGVEMTNYWAVTHPSQPNVRQAILNANFNFDFSSPEWAKLIHSGVN